jgi:predicted nucleotide-binding protein
MMRAANEVTNPDLGPRQNVVAEFGYFIGRLGRARVCTLVTSDTMELPTDFAGIVWEQLDHGGAWKPRLAQELRAAGFDIDLNKAFQ